MIRGFTDYPFKEMSFSFLKEFNYDRYTAEYGLPMVDPEFFELGFSFSTYGGIYCDLMKGAFGSGPHFYGIK